MNKTLDLAFAKAALLRELAQERLGRGLLARLDRLSLLQDEIGLGLADLEAGRSGALDVEEMIRELRTSCS